MSLIDRLICWTAECLRLSEIARAKALAIAAARAGFRSSAEIVKKLVVGSPLAVTSPATCPGLPGGLRRPAAISATGVVVTSSEIAWMLFVVKLPEPATREEFTVAPLTPTRALEL